MILDSNTKPIVHIATDEKFINAAYDIYEKAFPGKNKFIILRENQDKISYLSPEKDYEYIDVSNNYLSIIKAKIAEARIVVFHGMNNRQAQIALSVDKKNLTFIWTVFGYEVYSNPYLFGKELYDEKTYDQFVFSLKNKIKHILRPYYYRFLKGRKDPNQERLQALRKMNYVGILYEEELRLYIEKIGLSSDIKHLKFTYYPIDVVIDNNQGMVMDNNVLVGNSASFTNNHLEAFEFLRGINLEGRKIITPLSYGNDKYSSKIIKIGESIFGDLFCPLTEFLPLKEYQDIMQQCGIAIMNHYRQQAVGNVLNAMHLGAKIYLSKKNTLYHYLKRIGCHIYCIKTDLKPNGQNVLDLLDDEKINHNRNILNEELSLDRICSELQTTINPLLN